MVTLPLQASQSLVALGAVLAVTGHACVAAIPIQQCFCHVFPHPEVFYARYDLLAALLLDCVVVGAAHDAEGHHQQERDHHERAARAARAVQRPAHPALVREGEVARVVLVREADLHVHVRQPRLIAVEVELQHEHLLRVHHATVLRRSRQSHGQDVRLVGEHVRSVDFLLGRTAFEIFIRHHEVEYCRVHVAWDHGSVVRNRRDVLVCPPRHHLPILDHHFGNVLLDAR
mmetsp:Transcript_47836/g.95756  ORF Transcript_47836/g.95756 Transcript_47836/m.95756 type:complete len:230 (+) Transcript_47836:80-769(+)